MAEASISFFKVESCGYYPRGNPTAAAFGGFQSMFADLSAWCVQEELDVHETKTFDTGDAGDMLPVYCLGQHQTAGEGAIVTWNESETMDGAFGSVRRDSAVGRPRTERTRIPANSIPGHPSYFWYFPQRGMVAAIRFKGQRLIGTQGLTRYCQSFLHTYSPHVVRAVEDDVSSRILGYRAAPTAPTKKYFPRFRLVRARKSADIEAIRRRHDEIVKVLARKALTYTPQEGGAIARMFDLMGVPRPRRQGTEVKFETEVTSRPTLAELNTILDMHEEDNVGWDDFGFMFRDDPKKYWLRETMRTIDLDLRVTPDQTGLFGAEALAGAIAHHRAIILTQLNAQ